MNTERFRKAFARASIESAAVPRRHDDGPPWFTRTHEARERALESGGAIVSAQIAAEAQIDHGWFTEIFGSLEDEAHRVEDDRIGDAALPTGHARDHEIRLGRHSGVLPRRRRRAVARRDRSDVRAMPDVVARLVPVDPVAEPAPLLLLLPAVLLFARRRQVM